ncbi:MAG TPA: ImmA/IrrE family metallo-endopeptidase [Arachidicoccus sp.]|nr:ImmA/IrrE family metallo-endopeptidase [Arachidicoccus sp.]
MALLNQYFPQTTPHPGLTLAEKLEEMSMGPKEFALRTGKPEKTITAILKGESSITTDMAIQFENVTLIPAQFWINYQRGYDEYIAREKYQNIINEAIPWAKKFPLVEMAKKGWIEKPNNDQEKASKLLTFFGFSSHKAWDEYYNSKVLKVAFRISLVHTNEPFAISAWLRKGELQASILKTDVYSENKFKQVLPHIKTIMAKHPKNFFNLLQKICLEVGVKVVHTPCINKAPICGSTRWIKDTPLIQLTGRYNRNDGFWFTFFHEVGHILLHGKKDIFLEKVDYSDKDLIKEKEADRFAIKWLFSEEEENEMIQNGLLNEDSIEFFAKKFNTHPAIIIGRLHHKHLLPYSVGRKYLEPIELP